MKEIFEVTVEGGVMAPNKFNKSVNVFKVKTKQTRICITEDAANREIEQVFTEIKSMFDIVKATIKKVAIINDVMVSNGDVIKTKNN